jgi:hypothetical protein
VEKIEAIYLSMLQSKLLKKDFSKESNDLAGFVKLFTDESEGKLSDQEKIFYLSLTTQLLMDTNNYDHELIEKALKLIQQLFNKKNVFQFSERLLCGHFHHKEYHLRIFGLFPFLKYKNINNNNGEFIETQLTLLKDYLKNNSRIESKLKIYDYEKVLIAYALALKGDISEAEVYLNKIERNYIKPVILQSTHIEVAAYHQLIMLQLNQHYDQDSIRAVKWLGLQKKPDDINNKVKQIFNILAYKALAETQLMIDPEISTNLKIKIGERSVELRSKFDEKQILIEGNCSLKASGSGMAFMSLRKCD